MRVSTRVTGIVAATMITGVVTASTIAHAATQPSTLYVNGQVTCDNLGDGSAALPFCTIQAAANVVQPGQTVQIAPGSSYITSETVTLTRSGTPDAPIVFTVDGTASGPSFGSPSGPQPALTLSVVHDITVRGLTVRPSGVRTGILVHDSQRVTIDRVAVSGYSSTTAKADNVVVDGGSSDVTVSRGTNYASTGYGVHVLAGARGVTVGAVRFAGNMQGGVRVTGAGAAVTGNTLLDQCHEGISVDGAATGVTVANNLAGARTSGACGTDAAPLLSVAADSTAGTHVDYNGLYAPSPRYRYNWGGTAAGTGATFAAASGQGAHELDLSGAPTFNQPVERSPLIDSGDSDAPGVLDSDTFGKPYVDDPLVADTGAGTRHVDRGAVERQDTLALSQTFTPTTARVVPVDATVTAGPAATTGWGEPVSYSVDFGDGSDPVTVAPGGTASHTYTTPGSLTERITASTVSGLRWSLTHQFAVVTATAPVPTLVATPLRSYPRGVDAKVSISSDTWEVAETDVDFGDGYIYRCPAACTTATHVYPAAGTYPVTVTLTDLTGRTTSDHGTVLVGDGLVTTYDDPRRVYDSRTGGLVRQVPAHGVITLSGLPVTDGHMADAATLNVTVTNPAQAGYITVYPAGTARPTASTLNFAAGRTVANQVTAKLSATGLSFYNGSAGAIDLIVDRFGVQAEGGATYQPEGPVRVLDTRSGLGGTTGPVASRGSVVLPVGGRNGVPADATAVLLNVTATSTKGSGYVTVYGSGTPQPTVSTANWAAGQTVANLALVPVSNGTVILYNGSAGTANFVADLVGWYRPDTRSVYMPTDPVRMLDTRKGTGTGGRIAKVGAHQSLTLKVGGVGPVPASGLTAAGLNLTVTNTTAAGYLTAYPAGTTRATTSSLNYTAGTTVANATVTPVGTTGAVTIYNGGSAPVDVIADLSGYYFTYS